MTVWNEFETHIKDINNLRNIAGLLSWDQQCKMPPRAAEHRAEQLAMLTTMIHQRMIQPLFTESIDAAVKEANTPARIRAISEARRSIQRVKCLPINLVKAFTISQSKSIHAWAQAKEQNNFQLFKPHLQEMINLSRQKAACYDRGPLLYDNLLEDYDPGLRTATLDPLFARLKTELIPLVHRASSRDQSPPLKSTFSIDELKRINQHLITALCFDLDSGRLDESAHPFTMGLSTQDVRLTTRNLPTKMLSTLRGTIHECGHGLYEQGLPSQWRDMGLSQAPGAGIHESQSRFYENIIGGSLEFFKWLAPSLKQISPSNSHSAQELFLAANRVSPSLIRVEADESTYNLHIIIRYELEQALLNGDLTVADAPEAWNQAYEDSLGIRPHNDSEGILQDVHWSMGYFGYFPSYTLGNLWAASYKQALTTERPTFYSEIEQGEFKPTLNWLRKKIHRHGNLKSQEEIIKDAVGDRDHVADFITHLTEVHQQTQDCLKS